MKPHRTASRWQAVLPEVLTLRLEVREMATRDAAALAGYMTEPVYNRYLAVHYRSLPEVAAMIQRNRLRQGRPGRTQYRLAGAERSSGRAVADGFISLLGAGAAEVGWGVDPASWNLGYGTEIARALVALAVERLAVETVWCKVMAPNLASARVAARAGFAHVRTRQSGLVGLAPERDVEIYRLDADAYFEAAY